MKKIIRILILSSLVFIFFSCKRDMIDQIEPVETVTYKNVVLNSVTKEPERLHSFVEAQVDSNNLVLKFNSASKLPNYIPGDILIGKTNEGYLRKVESVSVQGNTLYIKTTSATLDEAFDYIKVDTSFQLIPANQNLLGINYKETVSLKGQEVNFTATSSPAIMNVNEVTGDFSFEFPNMSFKIERADKLGVFEIKAEKVKTTFNITLAELIIKYENDTHNNFSLVYSINNEIEWTNVSISLKGEVDKQVPDLNHENLFPKDIFLGTALVGPVLLSFNFNVAAGIEGKFSVGVGANFNSSYKTSSSISVGGRIINGQFYGIWEKTSTPRASFNFEPSVTMEGNEKIFLKPKLNVKLYELGGPTLFIRGFCYGEFMTPPIKVENGFGLDGGLGFNVTILTKKIAAVEWILGEKKWPLWTYLNNFPDIPTLINPQNNSSNQPTSLSLQWSCRDQDNDALTYDVLFGQNSPLLPLVSSGQASNVLSRSGLNYNTQYFWQIRAIDSRGAVNYSPVYNFITTGPNNNPSVPASPSPANGATSVTTSPTLSWTCSDPDGDALTYDIYFGTTANPTTIISANQTANSIVRTGLNASTKYYWKIVAKDSKSAITAGPEWSFTTAAANNPPAVPSSPSPANGATSVSTSPTLSWSCSDPDGDALTYDVYFGTTANPTTVISANQTANSIVRTGLNASTKYYWKIVAKDSKSATTASPEWSFTTAAANNPPSVPSSPSPANGATSVSTSPTLSWSCSDPDGDALTYDVYFGTTANPATLISANQTTRTITRTGLNSITRYYWKIVAKDSKGATTSGPEWNFTTLSQPTGKITGIVRDASTSSPLSGVTVTVYLSATETGTATSQSDGRYEVSVPGNNGYTVIFGKPGYLNAEYQNVNVTVNISTVLEPVLQIDQAYSGSGNISGTIKNALDGAGVASVSLKLRSGINVNSGTIITTVTTSSSGTYTFSSIPAGNYTIEATKTGFATAFFNVICLGGRTTGNQDATISPILTTETRIVLTWGSTPYDLDSHLTGPLSDGTRFHMYYPFAGGTAESPWPQVVVLDLDDTDSYGPETTTLLQKISGVYRFSVHDFTNRGSTSSTALSNSGAQVKIYSGSGLITTFNVPPNTGGTLWTVFEMSNNNITQINRMNYETDESNISKGSYSNPDLKLFKNLPAK